MFTIFFEIALGASPKKQFCNKWEKGLNNQETCDKLYCTIYRLTWKEGKKRGYIKKVHSLGRYHF